MSCKRLWEVEAVRDGRLSGAERAASERHVATCAECSGEARALSELSARLRRIEAPPIDEVSERRLRLRILSLADEAAVRPKARRAPKLLFAAALTALVALIGLGLRQRGGPLAVGPSESDAIEIAPSEQAVWSRAHEDATEIVNLESGALAVRVRATQPKRQLLVRLPDGELEDVGTVFRVAAADGRTTEVLVIEGRVDLRLRGRPQVTLLAGDVWRASNESPAAEAPSGAATSPPPPGSAMPAPAPSGEPGALPEHAATPPAAVPAASGAASASPKPPPAVDLAGAHFRRAMAALRAGAYAEAAEGFRSFRVQFPHDPRAEDAAYMRVVALQRAGNKDDVRAAAQEYKTQFPDGFRQREVAPITSATPAAPGPPP